jgi:hypothetical protein
MKKSTPVKNNIERDHICGNPPESDFSDTSPADLQSPQPNIGVE